MQGTLWGNRGNSPGAGWPGVDSEPQGSIFQYDVVRVHVAEVCRIVRYPCLFCGRLCATSEPSFTTYHWAMVQSEEPEAGTLRTTHMAIWGPGLWVDGNGPSGLLWLKQGLYNSAGSLELKGLSVYKSLGYSSWLACQGRLSPAREALECRGR